MNGASLRCLGVVVVLGVLLPSLVAANAPAGRYTTTAAGVLDTKTKLTWQQPAVLDGFTWAAGKTYCANLTLGGAGWRLPTKSELITLVDYTASPTIDLTVFPGTQAEVYLSSTSVAGSATAKWGINFRDGTTAGPSEGTWLVRCVR